SLAFRLRAFAVVFEAWASVFGNVSAEVAEAMAAMQKRGALPPPSRDPNRVEMVLGVRGDFDLTQDGMTKLDCGGDGEVRWHDVTPLKDSRLVDFTLEGFDPATIERGAAKLGQTAETLREVAR